MTKLLHERPTGRRVDPKGRPFGATGRFLRTIAAFAIVAPIASGCGRPDAPPVVVRVTADHPQECFAPRVAEPKLPDREITTDDVAVVARDRVALKHALRTSEGYRDVCRAALEAQGKGG